MYHPGKVLEVFVGKDVHASDSSAQAMLEMWDENLITVLVEKKLAPKMRKEDIVLVDYRPMKDKPAPNLTVTKILKGDTGKSTWKTYKDFHRKRKGAPAQTPSFHVEQPQPAQAYVG